MKRQFQQHIAWKKAFFGWAGALVLVFALVFALSIQPVSASPSLQQATATRTPTVTRTPTITGTAGTPAAGTGTTTVTPSGSATATRINTLAAPNVYGTSTQLVPVTGADLTQSGGKPDVGIWVALWLVGLLLIVYGLRLKLHKR